MFSHDTSGGFFTNDQDALSKNSGDPSAKLYSILNKLEDYRGSDGSFHFKLCYPEVTGIGGSSCNEWFQSSNPTAIGLKYGKIKGFKAISLAFTGGSVGPWKGIGKSVSTTNFIDDAPQSGAWWTAIGARRGHPKGSSKIPGPAPNVVTKVELYVLPAPGILIRLKLKGALPKAKDFGSVRSTRSQIVLMFGSSLSTALNLHYSGSVLFQVSLRSLLRSPSDRSRVSVTD